METLSLNRQATFKDIENALRIISEHNISEIKIPINFEGSGIFGIEGLALLLFATWMRKNPKNRIVTVPIISIAGFAEVCSTLHGICALRYSTNIKTVTELDVPIEIALSDAYESFRKVVVENFSHAYRDGYLAIPSFKAKGKNSEYMSPFYNGERLVSDDQFRHLIRIAIQAVFLQTGIRVDVEGKIKNIAAVVKELFSNTHKHARNDRSGNILQENFRAVIFNQKRLSKARLKQLIGAGGGPIALFGSYWESKGPLSLLDISVVDSGPGYAKRWIKGLEEFSIDEERKAIVECFTKHQSTDDKESSGSGLTNVLRDLKSLKGWFMLRTGSVVVEKSFLFDDDTPEITFNDVKIKSTPTEGVSFNIVIPLNELQGE